MPLCKTISGITRRNVEATSVRGQEGETLVRCLVNDLAPLDQPMPLVQPHTGARWAIQTIPVSASHLCTTPEIRGPCMMGAIKRSSGAAHLAPSTPAHRAGATALLAILPLQVVPRATALPTARATAGGDQVRWAGKAAPVADGKKARPGRARATRAPAAT